MLISEHVSNIYILYDTVGYARPGVEVPGAGASPGAGGAGTRSGYQERRREREPGEGFPTGPGLV